LNSNLANDSLHFPLCASPFLGKKDTNLGPVFFKKGPPPFSFLRHLNTLTHHLLVSSKTFAITMASKALVPFIGSVSTFALDGEASPANQALATIGIEEEAEHIAMMPLAIMPALGPKEVPREAI
jgi:hypothetical protein